MRSSVPATVTVEPGPPLPDPIAFAVYLVISEALTNIARYAHATSASVRAPACVASPTGWRPWTAACGWATDRPAARW